MPASSRPWTRDEAPASILAIRLQAFGDVTITLPYLRALARRLPRTPIDFLTRQEDTAVPRAVDVFRHVEGIAGGRSERLQLLATAAIGPRLALQRYPVVIDLQNNRVSRVIRRMLAPGAWAAFDRESPLAAGERTRLAIGAAGFPLDSIEFRLPMRDPNAGARLLAAAGWNPAAPLVIVSPSGAMPSRNWPIERYAEFAATWRERYGAQFAVVGLNAIAPKAKTLAARLGASLIDLTGRTSPVEAMAVVQRASLVLTEDCGLMHVAWTSGVPTLALFGSSRHDWSAPIGPHTRCLHSGDLECGACMDRACRYGDVHCLTRYSAQHVVAEAEQLLARVGRIDARGKLAATPT